MYERKKSSFAKGRNCVGEYQSYTRERDMYPCMDRIQKSFNEQYDEITGKFGGAVEAIVGSVEMEDNTGFCFWFIADDSLRK